MKLNRLFILFTFMLFSYSARAQAPPASTFGEFHSINPDFEKDEIPAEERQRMYTRLRHNISDLAKKGITAQNALKKGTETTIKFGWPLRKAAGFNDPSYYGISNYIDLDPTAGIKDYNCGTRTYDGHMGTDIFTVPFWWKKMDENSVEIVAAADGILVDKGGGIPDTSCANCPKVNYPPGCYNWNAVYLQHADGTLSIYGHMKKNSLTTKNYGDVITKGEFLGIVGSAGNSSGPHLHFEVWSDTFFTKVLDPWQGVCNTTQPGSLWESQQPYYKPEIIKVMTGTAIPEIKPCYNGAAEKTAETSEFNYGDMVYITTFIRDHRSTGNNYLIKLIGPSGNIIYNFSLAASTFQGYYTWLYYYYNWNQSTFTVPGTYKYILTYGTETQEATIIIRNATPLNLLSFSANAAGEKVSLNWQTTNEANTSHFEIEHGTSADNFQMIGKVATTGNGLNGNNNYSLNDYNPAPGINFYRLKMVDKDGKFTYSKIEKVNVVKINTVRIFPNPATNIVTLQGVSNYSRVRISSLQGSELMSKSFEGDELKLNISQLPAGVYLLQLGKSTFDYNVKLIKK
ncbi:MAG: peptidoglycan DD-metalloendopeptidase family protein [Ginsengibacter sp.]